MNLRFAIAIGVLAIALLISPFVIGSQYAMTLINVTGIHTISALGLLFLYGFCGQLSFCQAAFFAVGAYVSSLLSIRYGINVWLAMLCGALSGSIAGMLVGSAILRLRSHYFALATLGVSQIVSEIILNWKEVTGGTDGIINIPKPTILGYQVESLTAFFYLIVIVLGILMLIAFRLRYSRIGRAFIAVRSDSLAAELSGINVYRTKLLAFTLSALYAGIAGAMYAHMFSFISPGAFDLLESINAFAMVLVGGTASVFGPLIGSIVITILPEALRFTHEYYMLIYGLGLALLIMFLPGGVTGYLTSVRIVGPWKRRPSASSLNAAERTSTPQQGRLE